MENTSLNLDVTHFPQIAMRYTDERIRHLLVKMCQGLKMEVNEANLYSMAAGVERDLERVFGESIR